MSRSRLFPLALLLLGAAAGATAGEDTPQLAYEHYELPNGLDVILHEDHTVPVVGVNIWYHVGSGNEKPGRTGFAHLFEHMMFQGSEHHDTDYFVPLQKFGAFVNGSTTEFRTNYLEDVPADQLELALWLEADRMGFLLPAMTEEKFRNQQDVVSNEKRQNENQPYAMADDLLKRMIYPDEHPYQHTVIGSMEDLADATLEDVKEFFRLYYTPNNASLCVSGDFDPAQAKEWIRKYFAGIPAGEPIERLRTWIPRLESEVRATLEDKVELPRLYIVWPTPGWFQPGDAEFDLLGTILAGGKTSRLYQRLVYDLQIAQDVAAYQDQYEICSQFTVRATAAPGHTLAEIEAVLDEELSRLLAEGVAEKELRLAQTTYEAGFVRRLQTVGNFGGKADLLNQYNTLCGTPGYLERDLARYLDATPAGILDCARQYVDPRRRAVLHIVPRGALATAGEEFDRSVVPGSSGALSFDPPAVKTATLDNGLELYVVEMPNLPLVEADLLIKSGWSADPAGKPGTAALMGDLLDEGTRTRDALRIAEDARALGAFLGTGSFFDGTTVTLNVLRRNLDEGLKLVADVALNPSFPEAELERVRLQYLGRIQQESMQPQVTALKILQRKVFGEGHPYAQPFTGTGSAASLAALTRQDLIDYHQRWFLPNHAAMVFVGDITLDEARAAARKALGKWKRGEVPAIQVPAARQAGGPRLYVVDKPGAQQSMIVGGCLGVTRNDPDYTALQALNRMLGGTFISRINMNLREDKGYTYGARSGLACFRESGFFLCNSGVHTQFTKESLAEFIRELTDIGSTRPLTAEELKTSKDGLIQSFPQNFETHGGIAGQLGTLVQNGLPADEWQTYQRRVGALDAGQIAALARKHIRPDDMIWVIIGDWSVIEPGLRELDLGRIELVDPTSL